MAEEEPTIEELEQKIPDVRIILTDDGHTVMLFRDREGRSGKQFLSVYREFFQRLIGRCGTPDQGGTVRLDEGHKDRAAETASFRWQRKPPIPPSLNT